MCTVKLSVLETYTFVDIRGLAAVSAVRYLGNGSHGVLRMNLGEMKAVILKRRRQRVRRSTYAYVAALMLEDTAFAHPYRDRMIIDWWARVIDPLDAESFDEGPKGRLKYFRDRLKEHGKAPAVNAAIRQGLHAGKPLRRMSTQKMGYLKHQVRRLADRRLNYVATDAVLSANDDIFEQMTIGLIALPALRPGRDGGLLDRAARRASDDPRFLPLTARINEAPNTLLPGHDEREIERRIEQLSNPYDSVWLFEESYLSLKKRQGLMRKLEEEYLSKI
ncbi:hypothetical protein ASC75_12565 [Aminobacter sp. DSM 101952]|uniref:hypothetical protein n=1 Tax=Aminobacter sp. DSM 101952 TaxID=2735891 RepID=UPI0006F8BB68|nr:hypothetical protein [Aminobacter sp. DSM 101952]KQU64842.1 hypothetical protein ASC75_12565 [Aminobacter sp. DSM 101952]